jgi:hypothetical protein
MQTEQLIRRTGSVSNLFILHNVGVTRSLLTPNAQCYVTEDAVQIVNWFYYNPQSHVITFIHNCSTRCLSVYTIKSVALVTTIAYYTSYTTVTYYTFTPAGFSAITTVSNYHTLPVSVSCRELLVFGSCRRLRVCLLPRTSCDGLLPRNLL